MTHRINPAGEPITDDDATIAAAYTSARRFTLVSASCSGSPTGASVRRSMRCDAARWR